jgi:hypothetical protein
MAAAELAAIATVATIDRPTASDAADAELAAGTDVAAVGRTAADQQSVRRGTSNESIAAKLALGCRAAG